ncbi:hypothetical protein BKA93DRAFT_925735 [Sparassis latifolia]
MSSSLTTPHRANIELTGIEDTDHSHPTNYTRIPHDHPGSDHACHHPGTGKGHAVRGTVRSHSKAKHLHKTFKSYSDKLDIVIIEDIPKDGTFNETVKGVVAIEHTTSPFHFNALEPDELIGPAATCRAHSSTALHELNGNNKSIEEVEEQGRNVLGASKYRASKTLAGRAAWDFVAKNDEQLNWDLILLNPHTSPADIVHPFISKRLLGDGEDVGEDAQLRAEAVDGSSKEH